MANIDSNVVMKLEHLRFRKSPRAEREMIEKILQKKPISFLEVSA